MLDMKNLTVATPFLPPNKTCLQWPRRSPLLLTLHSHHRESSTLKKPNSARRFPPSTRNVSGQTLSTDILTGQTFSATTRPENRITSLQRLIVTNTSLLTYHHCQYF